MNKLEAFMRLTRIEHSAILVFAVIAAELISSGLPKLPILALSLIVPIFISMSSFAINDYFDVEADRANKRLGRPIASGQISKNGALAISIICMAIGIGASLFINLYAALIAIIFGALAVLYSYRLKDMLMVGNIYIAFTYGIAFIFGDLVVSKTLLIGIVAIFFAVFLAGLAREIHGMVRDYEGDSRARKTKNLLHYISKTRAAQIALVLYVESIMITIFLFFFDFPFRFNVYYLVPIAIGDLIIAYVAVACLIRNDLKTYRFTRNLTLVAMGVSLLGYLLAPLLYALV